MKRKASTGELQHTPVKMTKTISIFSTSVAALKEQICLSFWQSIRLTRFILYRELSICFADMIYNAQPSALAKFSGNHSCLIKRLLFDNCSNDSLVQRISSAGTEDAGPGFCFFESIRLSNKHVEKSSSFVAAP